MTRCTVCGLGSDLREAVDTALRNGNISLQDIAAQCGRSKAALHRHRQHLGRLDATGILSAERSPRVIDQRDEVCKTLTASTPGAGVAREERPVPQAFEESPQNRREQMLARIERLWLESVEGLEASKRPIRVEKPDGSVIEIPGHLPARASFIREARQTLELQATVSGDLIVGPNAQIMIVMPARDPDAGPAPEYPVIDIALPKR